LRESTDVAAAAWERRVNAIEAMAQEATGAKAMFDNVMTGAVEFAM